MKLPDGWKEVKISDIAKVDSGQGAPQGKKWYEGNNIFIKAGDLNNLSESKYVGDYCNTISNNAVSQYKLKKYPENSIVFPKSGMSVKTDNIAILNHDSYVVNHLAIIQLIEEDIYLAKYLYYLFKKIKISNLSLNDAYPSIRLSDIKTFSIALPPHSYIRKVVTILEKAEQLKQWRKESGHLTDDYLNSVFLEMFGHPVKNEKNWSTMPLQKISTISRGKSQHRPRNAPFLFGGKYPFIQTGDISNSNGRITSYSQTLSEAGIKQSKLFPKGTIVMSIAANIGYTAILDFNSYFPDSIVGIISNDDYILPTYLHHCLKFQQKKLEKEASSTAQKNINLRILNPLEVPVPPIELQNKFKRIIENIEKLKEGQKEAQQQIDDLFNVLMQKAFRGELNC